jgi:hypothetical protein
MNTLAQIVDHLRELGAQVMVEQERNETPDTSKAGRPGVSGAGDARSDGTEAPEKG